MELRVNLNTFDDTVALFQIIEFKDNVMYMCLLQKVSLRYVVYLIWCYSNIHFVNSFKVTAFP